MTDLNVYFSKERFVDDLNDLLNEDGVFDGTILYHRRPLDGEYIEIVDWNIWINVTGCDKATIMKEISKEMAGSHACGRVRDPEYKKYLMAKTDWCL